MPDFEALIKQQQLKSTPPHERLKIVEPINSSSKTSNTKNNISYFLFALIGFIAGCSLVMSLYLNNILEVYLNKLQTIF